MAKQTINVGTTANDKKGDSLRAAFQKVNANFTELYTQLGLTDPTLNLGAFTFTGSVMSTDDSTNIVIDRPITVNGEITVDGDIVPKTDLGASLGTPTRQFKSLYVSDSTVYFGGVPLSVEAGTNELTINNVPVSQTINYADIPNAPKDLSDLTDNSGSLGGGSTLVNGAYTVSLDANGNLTFPQGTLLGYSDPGGFIIDGAVDKDIAIYTYNGADAHGWTFGTDGSLTLPGDICSEGNINIDINLSDSTLRRWQFGEDGALTLPPGGTILTSSGLPFVYGITSINSSVAIGVYNDASGDYQYGTLSYDYAVNGITSGGFSIEYSRPLVGGNVDINVGNTIVNGDLTLSGDIKSDSNINIDINLADSTLRRWQFGEDGHLTLPAGGDIKDSTGTSVLGGGSGSSLVNGAYTVSLGSTGTLTVPANGIITAPINQEFRLQARAADSVLRNEINLDPNEGTYMSVWSEELSTSFSTGAGSWVTASWNNEDGFGAARFTGAEDLQDFWLTGPGSFVESVEVSINGGARGRAGYEGNNGGGYGVYLSVDQVPPGGPGTTVPITSLVFYFRTKNRIDIDYINGQLLLNTQSMNINLETNSYINLKSTRANPIRIITNNNTHMWEFDSAGSLTLPREGKIYGIGDGGPGGNRYGYISWDGESSGDGQGYNTMRLVPDQMGLEDADQYIILDPTSPGHIHIRAGGTQDNSLADLYLGGENSHIKIGAGANPPVTVMADDNAWIFGTDGAITTSDAFTIKTPNGVPSSVSNWVGGGGWNSPPYTNLATTGGTGTGLTVNVSTAAGGYININAITINTAGTGYTNGDVITINNENNIPGTFTIGVAGTNSWAFGTSGDLTIPGDIKGTANTSIIVDNVVLFANVTVEQAQPYGPSGSRVFISESAYPTLGSLVQVGDTVTIGWGAPITVTITNITGGGSWELRFNQIITAELILNPGTITITSAQVNTWTFDNDGGLTFPDGTVQTTAWTGTFSTLSVTGAVTAERFNTDQITVVGNRISTTVTNANLELECNGSGGVVINAIADATTASTVKSVGYLGLPQSATATSGTLAISDAGKHIYVTTAGQTISIPDNSLVAYPIGTTLTFIAGPSATTVLIVINTDTLRLAGSSSTGTRTLAANGMATAVKVASTLWYINGIGLT